MYGLFADSDRTQVKEKENLIKLMKNHDLINESDYDMSMKFWYDIAEIRKWFCHNNDTSRYYVNNRLERIKNYFNSAFMISTNKPEKIEDIQQKDWEILTFNLDSRFQQYLDVLKKGLLAWNNTEFKSDLLDEWITIYAKSLYTDKELIQNVLANIAAYEKLNQGISNVKVSDLANSYFKNLESSDFSEKDIEEELKRNNSRRSNQEIILECIRNNSQIIEVK